MDSQVVLLYTAVAFNYVLMGFHLSFWKLFDWGEDLMSLSFINRNATQVMNLALIYIFGFMGTLILLYGDLLISSDIGSFIMIAYSLGWVLRGIAQSAFFGNSGTSILLALFFLSGGIIHFIAWYI